jgi:hypothetical protein
LTQRLTHEELRARVRLGEEQVPVGGIYRHTASGRKYIVERVSLAEGNLGWLVTYSPLDTRDVPFTREMPEFLAKFGLIGVEVDA